MVGGASGTHVLGRDIGGMICDTGKSALNNIDRQAAARSFFVFIQHILAGFAHGAYDFVE
jgi:hypothetical protein